MTIKIWQSYSCNNSSSFRVIARFADAATAQSAADELEALFPVHAAEVDGRGNYVDQPSQATIALGQKYGFAWRDLMVWGSSEMIGDSPDVFVEDNVLVVLHTYCGGGLGSGFETYLEKRGATVDTDDSSVIHVTLLFRAKPGDEQLDAELTEMFMQRNADDLDDLRVEPLDAPWKMDEEAYGELSFVRDASTVGLTFPLDPRDLVNLKAWISERGIDKPVIRIGQRSDLAELEAIRKARCTACSGKLEYLHPALHDIESPQLVCRPCGGLYEVSAFTR